MDRSRTARQQAAALPPRFYSRPAMNAIRTRSIGEWKEKFMREEKFILPS